MSKLNIKKFAALCNLSVGTVSGIINKKPGFNEETIKFVHDQMRIHQYQPNPYAQKMQQGKVKSISIISDLQDNFFRAYIIKELIQFLYTAGYKTYVQYIQDDQGHAPLDVAVDCYIIMGDFPQLIQTLASYRLHAIVLDSHPIKACDFRQLYFDRSAAHKRIVEFFLENGHTHFGFIGKTNYKKYDEYEQALHDAGMQLDYYSEDSKAQNTKKIFNDIKKQNHHVAFFFPFEGLVLQFAMQCELHGLTIGSDISAITWGMPYDDMLPSADFTRIGAFTEETGKKILKYINNKSAGRKRLAINPEIHLGNTVANRIH